MLVLGSYASSSEIQQYLEDVIEEYELGQSIRYNSLVTHAEWDDNRGIWRAQINQNENGTTSTVESEILINAGGILNNPAMPTIPGLDTFAGSILHTAAWDDIVDLSGKRVAIIGAGASAIQLLPAIQKDVKHADVYIRTPSWISPPVALPPGVEKDHRYSEEEKQQFRDDPAGYLSMRKGLEDQFNGMFGAFKRDGSEQAALRARFEGRMKSLIRDENLQKELIPSFEAGCRRINPGEEYLLALQEENVSPIFDPIQEIVPHGVMTKDGDVHEADILIAATGFNTSFRPRFPIIGLDGVNLQNIWETNPVSYFGIAVSGFPNYLMFLGPNTPISNGSLMGPLEATSDYMTRLLLKLTRQSAKSFNIHPTVQTEFDTHTQSYMQDMVWTGPCRSWFKNNTTGKVTALWPGSSLHYMQVLAEDRWEDYEWVYHKGENRFKYFREGFSWIERTRQDGLGMEISRLRGASTVPDPSSDLSFYLDNGDVVPLLSGWREKDEGEVVRRQDVQEGEVLERARI
ncbi:flavin-containing monooxygenase [Aspergillus stella-maris]|uniref:flavin-containing monooxygenase n=1 Tax=Aspergillus stella-maris TaxID=1810926 RepID=UPI003CCDDBC8